MTRTLTIKYSKINFIRTLLVLSHSICLTTIIIFRAKQYSCVMISFSYPQKKKKKVLYLKVNFFIVVVGVFSFIVSVKDKRLWLPLQPKGAMYIFVLVVKWGGCGGPWKGPLFHWKRWKKPTLNLLPMVSSIDLNVFFFASPSCSLPLGVEDCSQPRQKPSDACGVLMHIDGRKRKALRLDHHF